MNDDMQDAQAPQEQPQAEPEQVNEAPQETPQEQPQEQTQEPAQQQTEETQPAQEPAPSQEPARQDFDISQYMPTQPAQPNIQVDEDGYIDPNQFYNTVLQDAEARIEEKLRFQEQERRAWEQVEGKYSEIKSDSELRDIINSQRLADVARGGKGDLSAIADKVVSKLQSYQQQGKAQAQVSEKVQKSAALQQGTANQPAPDDSELLSRLGSGDENAQAQVIQQLMDAGKL